MTGLVEKQQNKKRSPENEALASLAKMLHEARMVECYGKDWSRANQPWPDCLPCDFGYVPTTYVDVAFAQAKAIMASEIAPLKAEIMLLRTELDREVRANLIAEAQLRAWRDAVYVEGMPMRAIPDTELGDPVPPIPVVTPQRLIDLLDRLHVLANHSTQG